MILLVDTDVVSFGYKNDTRSNLYEPHIENSFPLISFMTLAELDFWTLKNNWGDKRKNDFAEFLENFLVIYPDENICKIWAKIRNESYKKGKPIATADAWIASIALYFDVPLITHNRKHFENLENLTIISES